MTQDEIAQAKEKILQNLTAPEEVQTDAGRVKNASVSQQIEALEYLERVAAVKEKERGQIARVGFYKVRNRD